MFEIKKYMTSSSHAWEKTALFRKEFLKLNKLLDIFSDN